MSELSWYSVKEDSSLYHYGVSVSKGKKILLDKEQADLHGSKRVEACEAPKENSEVAVLAEYQEWIKSKSLDANPKAATTSESKTVADKTKRAT
jgi:hypothetical protein